MVDVLIVGAIYIVCVDQRATQLRLEHDIPSFGDDVVARDPIMLKVLQTARVLARHHSAVLITGETGSGKEVIARVLHRFSARNNRPWIDVNCAALPEHLVESELFGHERGAFSGADAAKPGMFELANGGTLFLDEIGEIDPRVQVKLLRVLDASTFYRLGGTRKVSVDVRIIAATNRDLQAAVASGLFRRDLYHRITEFHLHVPPLRERPLDVAALAEYFLRQASPGKCFSDDAVHCLQSFDWPGNVRELRNAVTRMAVAAEDESITAVDVRKHLAGQSVLSSLAHAGHAAAPCTINEMERRMILSALESTGGNQSRAAERLGIPRRTLCRKLNEHQIGFGRRRGSSTRNADGADSTRVKLSVPVRMEMEDGACFVVQATDLSAGGVGLASMPTTISPGDKLRLQLTLPDSRRAIEAGATIAWLHSDGTAGAQFLWAQPSEREMLLRWLATSAQQPMAATERVLSHPIPA